MDKPLASTVVVTPPTLSGAQCIQVIRQRLNCTLSQAKVLVAGLPGVSCSEVAHELSISEATVRAHYHGFFVRSRCSGRNHATALAVAVLWQAAISCPFDIVTPLENR